MSTGPLEDVAKLKFKKSSERVARAESANDLRVVMSTREGRRFVWRLISDESLSYTGKAFSTAFQEGKRALRLTLRLELQRSAVKEYLEMTREALERVQLQQPAEQPTHEDEE